MYRDHVDARVVRAHGLMYCSDILGATPDAFIPHASKLVEFKCPFKRAVPEAVPAQYWVQCQMQMALSRAASCDLAYFIPRWSPDRQTWHGASLHVTTIRANDWWADSVGPLLAAIHEAVLAAPDSDAAVQAAISTRLAFAERVDFRLSWRALCQTPILPWRTYQSPGRTLPFPISTTPTPTDG